jgi:catechol 2,3-dioxygenase-like lactoylglutathione lyase family enzyme
MYPRLMNTVLDATDVRELAEFYRQLLGPTYRPGDEPTHDIDDEADWLVLLTRDGQRLLAFQQVETLHRTTWPSPDVPMQMHLCFYVEDQDLETQCQRAQALGAKLLLHRTDEPQEPLYVLADPAGHPFCLYTHSNAQSD